MTIASAVGTIASLAGIASPALSQEPGWHYSPLPGEGDRAALGCNREATPEAFTCLAVRCEDDYTVGLHVHASAPVQAWTVIVDREPAVPVVLEASRAPYAGRIAGDVTALIEALKLGGIAYLDAGDGSVSAQIRLGGSGAAITRALYFCAPRTVPSGDHVAPVDGQDGAGDEAGEGRAEE